MSTSVVVAQNNLPSDIAAMFGAVEPVLTAREKPNSLNFAGKVWKMTVDGQTTEITMSMNGEMVPAPMVKVILLNVGNIRQRNRAYFEGGFEEGVNKAPKCFSDDGVAPSHDVMEPYAVACKGCPKSVKAITLDENGKEVEKVPCGIGKVVCVIPSNKPNFPALRLQMKITSLWQPPENAAVDEKDNWRSFDAYMKHLAANGINNPAAVVTTMKFASNSNYPRILFKSGTLDENHKPVFEFVSVEIAKAIIPRISSEEVLKIVNLVPKAAVVEQKAIAAPVETPVAAPVVQDEPAPQPVVQEAPKAVKPVPVAKTEPAKVVEAPKPKPAAVIVENLADFDFNDIAGWPD